MPVKVVRFRSPNPGPHLTVLGSIHGDEPCGTKAIQEVLDQIENEKSPVLQGSVTFVPTVNVLAHERKVRFIDHDLNRNLRRRDNPVDYEDAIGNILCPILEECNALLDIHSYSIKGPPFVFVGEDNREEAIFRRSLGPEMEIYGLPEVFSEKSGRFPGDSPTGAVEYARQFGATSVMIECGQHDDPASVDVAIKAIRNALDYCRIAPANAFKTSPQESRIRMRIQTLYKRPDGGHFVKNWQHIEPVAAGETMAYNPDNTPIVAPSDGFVLLPHINCPVGGEWFCFGTNEKIERVSREET